MPDSDCSYWVDGKGTFTPSMREESGFFVPYDVKDMVQVSTSSGRQVFVGINNDSMRVFKVNDNRSR